MVDDSSFIMERMVACVLLLLPCPDEAFSFLLKNLERKEVKLGPGADVVNSTSRGLVSRSEPDDLAETKKSDDPPATDDDEPPPTFVSIVDFLACVVPAAVGVIFCFEINSEQGFVPICVHASMGQSDLYHLYHQMISLNQFESRSDPIIWVSMQQHEDPHLVVNCIEKNERNKSAGLDE